MDHAAPLDYATRDRAAAARTGRDRPPPVVANLREAPSVAGRLDGPAAGRSAPVGARRPAPSYAATRDRLATYFDRTAAGAWERLTSDAPVSRIRATVREGRAAMRAALLARLPEDMTGLSVLDAGCGPGDMAMALAARGARVTGVDLSGSLLDVARLRMPPHLAPLVTLRHGDMLADHGRFDVTIAMDVLIHYEAADIADALAHLAPRSGLTLFTAAPRTPLLAAMHAAGRLFPASDRAPRIVPHGERALARAVAARGLPEPRPIARVHRGFYISQAWEAAPAPEATLARGATLACEATVARGAAPARRVAP